MRSVLCYCCAHGCVGKKLADTEGADFVPLNTHVQVERFDLFVILTLGECIAGADVKGTVKIENHPLVIAKICIAIATALGIKFLAFDCKKGP